MKPYTLYLSENCGYCRKLAPYLNTPGILASVRFRLLEKDPQGVAREMLDAGVMGTPTLVGPDGRKYVGGQAAGKLMMLGKEQPTQPAGSAAGLHPAWPTLLPWIR